MKQLIFIIGAVLFAVSCRKGPEDPVMSLRSRKARLCRSWEISSSLSNSVHTSRSGSIVTSLQEIVYKTTDSLKKFSIYQGDTSKYSAGYEFSCQFFKDQNFLSTQTIHRVVVDTISSGVNPETFEEYIYRVDYDSLFITTVSGTWNFAGGEKDIEKKEALIIQNNTHVSTLYAIGKFTPVNGGPSIEPTSKSTRSEITGKSLSYYIIHGLSTNELILVRSLDSSFTTYIDSTFPGANRVSGEERIVLKNK